MTNDNLYEKSKVFIKNTLKKNLPKGTNVFLFGSRACGERSRGADIDIGVLGTDIDSKIIIKIKEEIAESFVPFEVDIVNFDDVDEEFKKIALRRIEKWNID